MLDINEPIDLDRVVFDPIYRRRVIELLNRKDGQEFRSRARNVDIARAPASIPPRREPFALVASKA